MMFHVKQENSDQPRRWLSQLSLALSPLHEQLFLLGAGRRWPVVPELKPTPSPTTSCSEDRASRITTTPVKIPARGATVSEKTGAQRYSNRTLIAASWNLAQLSDT